MREKVIEARGKEEGRSVLVRWGIREEVNVRGGYE